MVALGSLGPMGITLLPLTAGTQVWGAGVAAGLGVMVGGEAGYVCFCSVCLCVHMQCVCRYGACARHDVRICEYAGWLWVCTGLRGGICAQRVRVHTAGVRRAGGECACARGAAGAGSPLCYNG